MTPCERATYNPDTDAKVGSACRQCPGNAHTETEASVFLEQVGLHEGSKQVAQLPTFTTAATGSST